MESLAQTRREFSSLSPKKNTSFCLSPRSPPRLPRWKFRHPRADPARGRPHGRYAGASGRPKPARALTSSCGRGDAAALGNHRLLRVHIRRGGRASRRRMARGGFAEQPPTAAERRARVDASLARSSVFFAKDARPAWGAKLRALVVAAVVATFLGCAIAAPALLSLKPLQGGAAGLSGPRRQILQSSSDSTATATVRTHNLLPQRLSLTCRARAFFKLNIRPCLSFSFLAGLIPGLQRPRHSGGNRRKRRPRHYHRVLVRPSPSSSFPY